MSFNFIDVDGGARSVFASSSREPEICHLTDMLAQVNNFLVARPFEKALIRQGKGKATSCDNSVSVRFNDYTRLMMYADGNSLRYIDKVAAESFLNVRSYPPALSKKAGDQKGSPLNERQHTRYT
ncbi:hypothetical protein CRUP_021818 [Coryphaenoides rupestris]|nr:hypothetical protein CRUP_021818 [Coryphaenoides rupestris]